MWFLLIIRVRPTITPRASDRQYGAYSPEKAGTMYMPSELSTLVAIASIYASLPRTSPTSALDLMMPRLSRSHCTNAPAIVTLPSNA